MRIGKARRGSVRRACLLATTLLGVGLGARPGAAQFSGLYIGAAAGGNFLSQTINNRQPIGTFNQNNQNQNQGNNAGNIIGTGFSSSWKTGFLGLGNIGYGFSNGLRFELEGNYRTNGTSGATFFRNGNFQGGYTTMTGDQRSYGVMANVYYDFDLAAFSPGLNNWIQPYVGFGAGYASVSYRGFRVLLGNSSLQASMNGTGNVLAYQGIVGAAFPIGFLPGLSLTAEARYYATTQPAFSGSVQTVPQQNQNQNGQQQQPFTLSQFRGHVDVRATSLLLGVRYNFDAPAPAAAGGNLPVGWSVPALPAAARTYVVYFANDSAALDAVARQTIAESVQGARAAQASSLELVGRADATGNPQRNQRLATQRSENVAMELVRLGVPRGAIRTLAVGQNGEPPGVNAQARRVDIVLR